MCIRDRNNCLLKHELLQEVFSREIANRSFVSELVPIQSGSYLYYRNFDNPADSLTVYRYPSKEVAPEDRGKIPTKNLEENEEIIFKVSDLMDLYDNYALKVSAIKESIEQIEEQITNPTHNLLHWFTVDKNEKYAALVFNLKDDGKYFDIYIKDLKQNKLLPIIIRNSDGDIAFDQLGGFYYTLRDGFGRGNLFYNF